MTVGFLEQLAYLVAIVAVPAAAVSAIAFACAKQRSARLFVYSVLLLSCVAAIAIPVFLRWWNPYLGPLSWHDFLGAFISWAPVFLLSSALVWSCVKGSSSRGWIPVRATIGVILAIPIGFIVGVLVQ